MATVPTLCRLFLISLTVAFPFSPALAQTELADRRESVLIRVIDAKSQQPLLAELKVSMCDDRSCFPVGKFSADPLGMHIIKLPKEIKGLTVWVYRRSYVPKVLSWSDYHKDIIPPEYTVKLEAGASIGGAIRDEQGKPVADAKVAVQGPGNEAMSVEQLGLQGSFQTETTDAAGQWSCDNVPARFENLTFHVTHPDFAPASFQFQKELWDGKAVMILKRGAGLSGVVLGMDGRPIRSAEIFVGASQFHRDSVKALTDEHGRFALGKIPPGEKRITVTAEGFAPETRLVEIGANSSDLKFELDLGGKIRGTIVDADGKPIEGVFIGIMFWKGLQVLAWNTRTDKDGRFSWNSAPHGEARYNIGKEGFMEAGAMFKHGEDQTIRLEKAVTVSGTVVDASTGEPIPHFQIIFGDGFRTDGKMRYTWQRHQGKKGHGGKFAFDLTDGLGAVMYLRVEAKEYRPIISEPFTNTPGNHQFTFKLEKAPPVTGLVKLPDGRPAAGATLVVCSGDNHAYMSQPKQFRLDAYDSPNTRTDERGAFSLPPLSDAEALIIAHEGGFIEIPFSTDQTNKLEFLLKPWARVSGRVLLGRTPATNHEVMVSNDLLNLREIPPVQLFITGKTDKNGYFFIEGIPPGEHTIAFKEIAEAQAGRTLALSHKTRVTFKAGEETKMTLGGSGRPIIGKVVGTGSEKVDWAHQIGTLETDSPWPEPIYSFREFPGRESMERLRKDNEIRKSIRTTAEGRAAEKNHREFLIRFAEDGSFRAEDVPPGKYRGSILAAAPRESHMVRRIELGVARFKVTVPEIPVGRTDEPLNVGSVDFKAFPPREQPRPSPITAR
jgi:hypothetical protein